MSPPPTTGPSAPHRSLLAQASASQRLRLWSRSSGALFADAWEDLCRWSVPRLVLDTRAEAGFWGPAARLWGQGGPEWDVVAKSVDGEHLLLGEVKWQEQRADLGDLRKAVGELTRKGVPHGLAPPGTNVVRAIFVPEADRAARGRVDGVKVTDAEAVIGALSEL